MMKMRRTRTSLFALKFDERVRRSLLSGDARNLRDIKIRLSRVVVVLFTDLMLAPNIPTRTITAHGRAQRTRKRIAAMSTNRRPKEVSDETPLLTRLTQRTRKRIAAMSTNR